MGALSDILGKGLRFACVGIDGVERGKRIWPNPPGDVKPSRHLAGPQLRK